MLFRVGSLVARSFRIFVLTIAGMVFAQACEEHEPLRCRFDSDISEHDREIIAYAMTSTWNPVATREIVIDPDGDERISLVDAIYDADGKQDGRECTNPGKYCAQGNWIRIQKGLSDERLFRVAAHEVGHALGLGHITEPGVMQKGTLASKLSRADIVECQRVNACVMVITWSAQDEAPFSE